MSNGNGGLPAKQTLPSGWSWATTDQLFTFVTSGSRGWAKHYAEEGPMFIRVGNLNHASISLDLTDIQRVAPPSGAEAERTIVRPGDLLISVTADVGMVGLAPITIDRAYINQHIALSRPTNQVLGKYLAWYLASEHGGQRQFKSLQRGATKAGLGLDDIRSVHVPVAPRGEQDRIVARIEELFSDLDAGVAALVRAKANLKRYRAAVLKAAVEGKLTEEWRAKNPPKEPAAKLLERILKERRQKWEQDQLAAYEANGKQPPKNWRDKYHEPVGPDTTTLPALPQGWCWATIEQLLIEDSCNGVSVKGTNSPPGIPALRLSAMSAIGFNYGDRRYIPISESIAEELAIRTGDFFASRGNGSLHLVGRGTLAQEPPERIVFPDTMIRLRFATCPCLRQYVALIWESRHLRKQIEGRARTTAGIYKISQKDIDRFVIPLPPSDEQLAAVQGAKELMSVVAHAEAQMDANLHRAARLRQSILKRAFEGNLVPQDPTDEPASKLLARIRTAAGESRTMTTDGKPAARRTRRSAAMTGEETEP